MATKVYASLSTDGFVHSTELICDNLLADFFTSMKSQSTRFPDSVHSFQWLLQRYQNDIPQTRDQVRKSLDTYFRNTFSQVEVEVTTNENAVQDSRVTMRIYVRVVDEAGKEFVLGRLAYILDGKAEKVMNLNNLGPGGT